MQTLVTALTPHTSLLPSFLCTRCWVKQYSMEVSRALTQGHRWMPGNRFKLSSENTSVVKTLSSAAKYNVVVILRVLIMPSRFFWTSRTRRRFGVWFWFGLSHISQTGSHIHRVDKDELLILLFGHTLSCLVYVLPGTKPRALCLLGKHSANRTASPDP